MATITSYPVAGKSDMSQQLLQVRRQYTIFTHAEYRYYYGRLILYIYIFARKVVS